ncbi:MAG: hypothetical protein JSR59_12525 [Proteobacteria bacterium]|nr:hypothetical protein [Pseudomonadota bacterium]
MNRQPTRPEPGVPWFRYRIVWFMLALPVAAVIGSVASAVIATRHADPAIVDHRPTHALAAEDAAEGNGRARSMLPAEVGRNHATTPLR